MTMSDIELKERWDTIQKGDGYFVLVDRHHPVDINIGYTNSKFKTLLITNSGPVDDVQRLSSKAITVENYKSDQNDWILSFCLTDTEKEDIFIRLCWDIIETSRSVEKNVINFIITRYKEWAELMKQKPLGILSVSRQKGLIGEILYLQKLIPELGVNKAVNSWSGPDWAAKDFVYDNWWAEIKAVRSSADAVGISSLEQLESEKDGSLVIYRIDKTTVSDKYGFTLPELIDKTEGLINEESLSLADFRLKLSLYGYNYSKEYDAYKFLCTKRKIYHVNAEFPRLTRSLIDSRILCAEYELSIQALEPFEIEDE